MKKITIACFSLFGMAATGFSDDLKLDNQTSYPGKDHQSKIAIQWAGSAKEVQEGNQAMTYGFEKLKPETLQIIPEPGTVNLKIPDKAEYFRVLVWSTGKEDPDLITNWVDVVPKKTYTLEQDHLVPVVLMIGMGC